MNRKHPLVFGTLILTFSGLISRIIGFFFRIFLSYRLGEEAMGIYQLLSPLLGLTSALCISGIQSFIAKQIAEGSSKKVLYTGTLLSVLLSALCSFFIFFNARFLAVNIFFEERLITLMQILSLSLPLSSIHSCINGYFYGKKMAKYPALLQLIEQSARVLCVCIIFFVNDAAKITTPVSVTVTGLLVGEIFSSLFSILFFRMSKQSYGTEKNTSVLMLLLEIFRYSVPLATTRIIVGLLQSIENIYIPQNLILCGYETKEALSMFGVLTGMALPLILFPTAITNSLSSMLLPAVSELNAPSSCQKLKKTIQKSISFCLILGFLCLLFFFILGKILGSLLFHSSLAGTFIMTLSFICPFLYTNASLNAIINGLGKTGFTFLINTFSTLIRLLFVFAFIPTYGILAYLWALLLSQLFSFITSFIYINHKFHFWDKNFHFITD